MDIMTWSLQTSANNEKPIIIAEYVLNDLGIFIKRERRMPKSGKLTALTGFRVGYVAIPNTDYRAAPLDRNVILWEKITSAMEDSDGHLMIFGNQKDTIKLTFTSEYRAEALNYIHQKRRQHPANVAPDYVAASWMCWRDDDEWEEPFISLVDMIANELEVERFIEPEILEETRLMVEPESIT